MTALYRSWVGLVCLLAPGPGCSAGAGQPPDPQVAAAPPASRAAGASLPLRSSGQARGESWVLSRSGYVGGYLQLERAGVVGIRVRASGRDAPGGHSRFAIAAGDTRREFDLDGASGEHGLELELPAGTHVLRIDLGLGRRGGEGAETAAPDVGRELSIERVEVVGARLILEHDDARALAAANGYIQGFRRGRARLRLEGAAPGTPVRAELVRHAFGFGANVPYGDNKLIPADMAAGSDAERFQKMFLDNFNLAVPSNAGKWVYHEEQRDRVSMQHVDRFFAFAERHGLASRMHTLLWDTAQQPAWVVSEDEQAPGLLTRALAGDASARQELIEEIDERIEYYVRQRARHYGELDVLNESLHRPRYFELLGPEGLADIFRKSAAAVQAAGASTRLYLNEYNLLQWSKDPRTDQEDPYANWYRWHAEEVLAAGAPLDGLGVQYYADVRLADAIGDNSIGDNAHSPARILAVLHNLASTGLRLTLTEFEARPSEGMSPDRGADVLEETLRLAFGTPQMDGFLIWAIWAHAAQRPSPLSLLYGDDHLPTAAGRRFAALMQEWSTTLEAPLDAAGQLELQGFYGDYALSAGDRVWCFSLEKGEPIYVLRADAAIAASPAACRTAR